MCHTNYVLLILFQLGCLQLKVMLLVPRATARSRSKIFMSEEAGRYRAKRGKFCHDIYVGRREMAQKQVPETPQMFRTNRNPTQITQLNVSQSNLLWSHLA